MHCNSLRPNLIYMIYILLDVSNIKDGRILPFFLPAEKGRPIKNLSLYVFTIAAAMAVSIRSLKLCKLFHLEKESFR